MQEIFHQFGQAYLDNTILDESGATLPFNPRPGETLVFNSSSNQEATTNSFILKRYTLNFNSGNQYQLVIESLGGEGISSVKPSEEGDDWGTIPDEVNASCGSNSINLLITTTVPWTDGPNFHSLDITTNATETLECDTCLVGHWWLDSTVLSPYIESRLPADGGLELVEITGGFNIEFRADGTFTRFQEDYGFTASQIFSELDNTFTQIVVRLEGTTTGNWGVTEAGLLKTWNTFGVFEQYGEIYIDDVLYTSTTTSVTTDAEDAAAHDEVFSDSIYADREFEYTCTATTLTHPVPPEMLPITEVVYIKK